MADDVKLKWRVDTGESARDVERVAASFEKVESKAKGASAEIGKIGSGLNAARASGESMSATLVAGLGAALATAGALFAMVQKVGAEQERVAKSAAGTGSSFTSALSATGDLGSAKQLDPRFRALSTSTGTPIPQVSAAWQSLRQANPSQPVGEAMSSLERIVTLGDNAKVGDLAGFAGLSSQIMSQRPDLTPTEAAGQAKLLLESGRGSFGAGDLRGMLQRVGAGDKTLAAIGTFGAAGQDVGALDRIINSITEAQAAKIAVPGMKGFATASPLASMGSPEDILATALSGGLTDAQIASMGLKDKDRNALGAATRSGAFGGIFSGLGARGSVMFDRSAAANAGSPLLSGARSAEALEDHAAREANQDLLEQVGDQERLERRRKAASEVRASYRGTLGSILGAAANTPVTDAALALEDLMGGRAAPPPPPPPPVRVKTSRPEGGVTISVKVITDQTAFSAANAY